MTEREVMLHILIQQIENNIRATFNIGEAMKHKQLSDAERTACEIRQRQAAFLAGLAKEQDHDNQ